MWLNVCYAGCAVRALRNKVMKIYRWITSCLSFWHFFCSFFFWRWLQLISRTWVAQRFRKYCSFQADACLKWNVWTRLWNGLPTITAKDDYLYCSKMLARCSKQLIWWDMWEIRTNRAKFETFEMRTFLESAAIDWSQSKECKLGAKLPKQMGQTEQKQTSITV